MNLTRQEETVLAIDVLRSQTSQHHRILDSALAIGAPNPPLSALRPFMRAMLGWLQVFDAKLDASFWADITGKPENRQATLRFQKQAWLVNDLLMLGETTSTLEQLPLPVLKLDDDKESLIGYAYVIEGSRLGTRVLEKHFAPLLAPQQSLWLTGYGEQTGPLWRECREAINRHLVSSSQMARASSAAIHAFSSLHTWCLQQGATR